MPVTLLLGAMLLAASPPARPAKLGLCVACHGENGIAVTPDAPHLAAQRESYLVAALAAYRAGTRRHAAMQAVAGTLGPRDIADAARWYAAQLPARPASPAPAARVAP